VVQAVLLKLIVKMSFLPNLIVVQQPLDKRKVTKESQGRAKTLRSAALANASPCVTSFCSLF